MSPTIFLVPSRNDRIPRDYPAIHTKGRQRRRRLQVQLLAKSYYLCWVGPFLPPWPSCHLLSVVLPFHWDFKLKATIRAESLFDKATTITDNRKMFCYVAGFFTKLYHVLLNEFSNSSNYQMLKPAASKLSCLKESQFI